MSEALIDRLSLNPDRIEAMAEGLRQVAELHDPIAVSYTHLRAHETDSYLVCRLLLEKKKKPTMNTTLHRQHTHQIQTRKNT